MKLAIISFTDRGGRLNDLCGQALAQKGYDCSCYSIEKYAGKHQLEALDCSLKEWTGRMFSSADGILFIGAAGIAVRSIAPFVEDKTKDPAIVVMDEKGMFAISLMSGHLGGANELAGVLANLTGAIPVITTATDVNGRFAVDVFAKKNHLVISDMKCAKAVSADVLDEKQIGFYTDFPVLGEIPQELEVWDEEAVFEGTNGICVTLDEQKYLYKQTLFLIPRIVTLGIGCKKNTPMEVIEQRVREEAEKHSISIKSIKGIASIDLKKDEPGITGFAQKYHLPFETFTAEELQSVEGDFSASSFVAAVTGVSNVCERSAVLAGNGGRLIVHKSGKDGVTVAMAVEDFAVTFE